MAVTSPRYLECGQPQSQPRSWCNVNTEKRIQKLQEELKEARETISNLSRALSNVTAFLCACNSAEARNNQHTKIDSLSQTDDPSEVSDLNKNDIVGDVSPVVLAEEEETVINGSQHEFLDSAVEEVESVSEYLDEKDNENNEELRDIGEDENVTLETEQAGNRKKPITETNEQQENGPSAEKERSEEVRDAEEETKNVKENDSNMKSAPICVGVMTHIMDSVDEIKELIKNMKHVEEEKKNSDGDEKTRSAIEEFAEIMKEKSKWKKKEDEVSMMELRRLLGESGKWVLDRFSIYHGKIFIDDGRILAIEKFKELIRHGQWTIFPDMFEVQCWCNQCADNSDCEYYYSREEKHYLLHGTIQSGFSIKCRNRPWVQVYPTLCKGFKWYKYSECSHFEILPSNISDKTHLCGVCGGGSVKGFENLTVKAEERIHQLQEELKEARETIINLSRALSNVTACRCSCKASEVPTLEISKALVDNTTVPEEWTHGDSIQDSSFFAEIVTAEEIVFNGSRREFLENAATEFEELFESADEAEKESKKEEVNDAEDGKEKPEAEESTEKLPQEQEEKFNAMKAYMKYLEDHPATKLNTIVENKSSDVEMYDELRSVVKDIAGIMKEEKEWKKREDGGKMAELKSLLGEDNKWILERISIYNGKVFINDGRIHSFEKFKVLMRQGEWTLFPEEYEAVCRCGNPNVRTYYPLEGSLDETGFRVKCCHDPHGVVVYPYPSAGFKWFRFQECGHDEILPSNVNLYGNKLLCGVCGSGSQCREACETKDYVYPRKKGSQK